MKTIEKNGVDVDAVMKGSVFHCLDCLADVDIAEGEVVVPKAKEKKLKRKQENKGITFVEEEIKNTMEIDATTGGTELGAPGSV